MKTSTVKNIPESMEISSKGLMYAYRVTPEYTDWRHGSIWNRLMAALSAKVYGVTLIF